MKFWNMKFQGLPICDQGLFVFYIKNFTFLKTVAIERYMIYQDKKSIHLSNFYIFCQSTKETWRPHIQDEWFPTKGRNPEQIPGKQKKIFLMCGEQPALCRKNGRNNTTITGGGVNKRTRATYGTQAAGWINYSCM